MKVSTSADWCWQNDTSCVECLPDTLKVATAGDFLDEDWCQALLAKLLVNAEEVDLGCVESLLADTKSDWYTGDEGDQLARLRSTYTDVPVRKPAWGQECPRKLARIYEVNDEKLTISGMKCCS